MKTSAANQITRNDFNERYEKFLDELKNAHGGMKKVLKRQAFDLTEAEHLTITGSFCFPSWDAFQHWRSVRNKNAVARDVKKKYRPAKRTEFDSKFNWLF